MEQPKRFEPWPWAFVVFFLVVFAANGVFVYLSQSSWTGLVTRDHYQKGLQFNEVLAAQRAQDALGWRLTVEEAPPEEVRIRLLDRDGRPLRDARVEGVLFRPTREGYDEAFTLAETEPGHYQGRIHPALKGLWDLRLTARTPGGEFHYAQRITIP